MRMRPHRHVLVLGLAAALTAGVTTGARATAGPSPSGMTTNRIADGLTATDLANALVGSGVTLNGVSYTGAPEAAGTFAGGDVLGFADGVVLASGDVDDALGPNQEGGTTTAFGTAGDADLAAITGQDSYDAAVLELGITPSSDTLTFQYVFGSEEYEEFIGAGVNDVFAFFVEGTNCATFTDGDGATQFVSIDTVNPFTNAGLYRGNTDGSLDIEYDGLTVVMTCTAAVQAGVPTTMKLAISDSGDEILDSAVFLQAGSITSQNTVTTYTGDLSEQYSDVVDLSATVTEAGSATPVAGGTVEFTVGTQSVSAATDANGVATAQLTLDQPAQTTTVTAAYAGDGDQLTGSSDEDPFEILLEDCTLTSTTPTSGAPGSTTLSAQMAEVDASVGDLSGHQVDFSATDLTPTTVTGSGTTDGTGVATTVVDLSPGFWTIEADFAGDEFYAPCAAGPAEYTAASAGQDAKVTGGGRVVDETGHVTFGFVAEVYEGVMEGQLQVNDHRDPAHRFHGYELTSLQVDGNTATWSGVGRLDGVDGYAFEATIVDNRNGRKGGKHGTTTADHVTFTIMDGSGAVVWTLEGGLEGGNVKVHE